MPFVKPTAVFMSKHQQTPVIHTSFSLGDCTIHSALYLLIDQAQGQFLEDASVDFQTTCFPHGLLHIACSLAGSVEQLCYMPLNKTFQKSVYPFVFYNFVFGRNVKRSFRGTCISASLDITLNTPNVDDEWVVFSFYIFVVSCSNQM